MLLIKLTEREDGSIVAETPRRVIGTFPNATREDVIAFLQEKAEECGEEVRIVDEFEPQDREEYINFARLMRRRY